MVVYKFFLQQRRRMRFYTATVKSLFSFRQNPIISTQISFFLQQRWHHPKVKQNEQLKPCIQLNSRFCMKVIQIGCSTMFCLFFFPPVLVSNPPASLPPFAIQYVLVTDPLLFRNKCIQTSLVLRKAVSNYSNH